MSGDKKDNWEALRGKLEEEGGYPKVYMFKFILPSDNKSMALVQALFGSEAIINQRSSKNGKYISITAKEMMLDVEQVIKRYEKAMKIEGLIAL